MEPQLIAMLHFQPLHHVCEALPTSACPQRAASASRLSVVLAVGPTSHVAKHRSLRIRALGKFLSGLGETLSILSFLREPMCTDH